MEKVVKIIISTALAIAVIIGGIWIGVFLFQDNERKCWDCGDNGRCDNKTEKVCPSVNAGCVKMQIHGDNQTLTVKVRFLKEEQKAPEKCSYKEHEIL
jgi:hypothetical protein